MSEKGSEFDHLSKPLNEVFRVVWFWFLGAIGCVLLVILVFSIQSISNSSDTPTSLPAFLHEKHSAGWVRAEQLPYVINWTSSNSNSEAFEYIWMSRGPELIEIEIPKGSEEFLVHDHGYDLDPEGEWAATSEKWLEK